MDRTWTIRLATTEDDSEVAALHPVDGIAPAGTVVVADVEGTPAAAVGLADGSLAADPERSSPAMLAALRLRRWEAWLIGAVFGY